MQSALPIICLSLLLMSGCSLQTCVDDPALPRLRTHQPHMIVQVPGNYQAHDQRDHPYYVVCDRMGCATSTPKTPVEDPTVKPSIIPHATDLALKTTTVTRRDMGPDTTQITHPVTKSRSDSYRRKTATILEKYRVHFDYASHRVGERFQSLLQEFVTVFSGGERKVPNIRVTGYTDSVTVPNPTVGNEWLALERAISVKRELVSLGYPENRILLEAKFLCCYLDTNETYSGRYNNRRAEISLIQTME